MAGLAKGQRVGAEQRRELTTEVVKRYQGGETIRQLADDLGRSYGFVHGLLTASGVELRARGGARRRREVQ